MKTPIVFQFNFQLFTTPRMATALITCRLQLFYSLPSKTDGEQKVSRTSSYSREKCAHPHCISGGVQASCDESCWLNFQDNPKNFCSTDCKEDYLKNINYYKELEKLFLRVDTKNSRDREKLAKAMYLLAKRKVSKKEFKKMIDYLNLSSMKV